MSMTEEAMTPQQLAAVPIIETPAGWKPQRGERGRVYSAPLDRWMIGEGADRGRVKWKWVKLTGGGK